jgi:hypothetical protein
MASEGTLLPTSPACRQGRVDVERFVGQVRRPVAIQDSYFGS